MRVLVTSTPGTGHLFPLMPVVQALRDAGDELLWAAAPDSHERIRAFGLATAAAGMAGEERAAEFARRWPEVFALPPRARRPAMFSGLFATLAAPRMADALGPIIDEFKPGVVLTEAAELATAPVAAKRGIPVATMGFGALLPEPVLAVARERIRPLWEVSGLDVPADLGLYSTLYLHPFPTALSRAPGGLPIVPVKTLDLVAPDGHAPEWTAALGRERPCVYVTLGTEMSGLAPWADIIEAANQLDADAVVTTGPRLDPATLPAPASNVRLERFVPQHHILDRASLLVSHAGSGSLLGAAARGLPQLCVPLAADQWDNADALTHAGCALTLEQDRSAAAIRAAIDRLLAESSFRTRAQEIAVEMAAMPHPREHVERIHELAP